MPAAKTSRNGHAAPRAIDLDAARIARKEVAGESVAVKLGGQTFTMPAEMPIEFADYAKEGEMRKALTLLFGEQAEEFMAQKPSVEDVKALMEGAARVYGLDVGESMASETS